GSITDTTHAPVRYIPRTKIPWSQEGASKNIKISVNLSSIQNKILESMADGILAPTIVNQKIKQRIKSIMGNPVHFEVKMSSSLLFQSKVFCLGALTTDSDISFARL